MSSEQNPTRRKILHAAWQLLEADAPGKVRLGDIAKQAGISRQALYLHFSSRSELLTATARFIDEEKNVLTRLEPSRHTETGRERLRAFLTFWAGYLPEIQGVARAFMAMEHADDDARAAWADRMQGLRHGCEAAVAALHRDDDLREDLPRKEATDMLWTLMSVANWQQLTITCEWSQARYQQWLLESAERLLLRA